MQRANRKVIEWAEGSGLLGGASPTAELRVISLGAGVQSTTMALMAAHGEVGPMPDAAIFADTGWEPAAVYEHLEWLRSANVLPFPVHIVTAGNLRDVIGKQRPNGKYARVDIPAFVAPSGMITRSCTKNFKIEPLRRQVRQMAGLYKKRSPDRVVVEQWIGISCDEAHRIKPSGEAWIQHRWPLIEQGMSRSDCLQWMASHGYPQPPKSSCIGCPFHSDEQWRSLTPDEFADAVAIDRKLRDGDGPQRTAKGDLYLHSSLKPLDEVDLSTDAERGQPDLFANECEGMCGV